MQEIYTDVPIQSTSVHESSPESRVPPSTWAEHETGCYLLLSDDMENAWRHFRLQLLYYQYLAAAPINSHFRRSIGRYGGSWQILANGSSSCLRHFVVITRSRCSAVSRASIIYIYSVCLRACAPPTEYLNACDYLFHACAGALRCIYSIILCFVWWCHMSGKFC